MKAIAPIVALALAAPLAAQQPDTARWHPGMPMGHGMMGPGMMMERHEGPMMGVALRVMVFTPAHLLLRKDELKLTDAQVAKLTALRDHAKTARDAAMADIATHRKALTSLLETAAPDTTQLKPHFLAIEAAMTKDHWATLAAATQARGLLTDVQRARVDGWADAMEQLGPMMMLRHEMGPGMMMPAGPGGMGMPPR
jgi:LTXXQ motif family protein